MDLFNPKNHWENIYQTKKLTEVSWYQPVPETSLAFFQRFEVPLEASIIDIGGGDSFLTDHLLSLNYKDVSVLDISETAIRRAKQRLGNRANNVTWLIEDISTFKPSKKYAFWHDRAAFHFLTNQTDIFNYVERASQSLNSGGILVVGTFSENGPQKCSGIEIHQYSETSLVHTFEKYFENIECLNADHLTPFGTIQNFTFCSFKKR